MEDIKEIIKKRESVRNYDVDQRPTSEFAKLKKYVEKINQTDGPFGNKIKVFFLESSENSNEMKLGTYGMIRGAKNYLVVTCEENPNVLLDLGYLFEELILYATSIGLSTVWMAGTFSRKHFKKAIENDQVMMPIVSPVGLKGKRKSLITKYVVKSKSHVRKDFSTLFFDCEKNPLVYDKDDIYMEALEMVRLAPSAMNKQPWRVVREENQFHFFTSSKLEMTQVDIGIALYHFVATLSSFGVNGSFKQTSNNILDNYVTTYTIID